MCAEQRVKILLRADIADKRYILRVFNDFIKGRDY